MTFQGDIHVEAARLQQTIQEHLGIAEGNLVFDYTTEGNTTTVNLITVNTRHNQSFLFHSEKGVDKLDALKKLYEYVREFRARDNSYTIQWTAKGEEGLHTSYFRAASVYDALDKLYFGRDLNALTVYSVVMNPVT